MSIALIVSFTGVLVAGLAGILGVWMERDPKGKAVWALMFSAIIVFATGIEMVHTVWQTYQDGRTDAQMAVLLEQLTTLSEHNPELQEFVAAELAVQSRANPEMVQRLEANVKAKGGDPDAVRQMAARGRRGGARDGDARPAPRQRARPEPKAGAAAAAAPAPAPAAAAPAAAAAAIQSGDPDAAMAAANAEAERILADANAQADAVKAEADKVKKQAEQIKAQADKAKREADKALKAAKDAGGAVNNLTGGGGGGGKGGGGKGGGGSKPKIPGL